MKYHDLDIPNEQIADFCHKWKVQQMALFGSVLRDDFRSDSDVDVLITFEPAADISLFDLGVMQQELETMFGRHVDLVEEAGLRNPFRRHAILNSREIVYAA